MYDLQQLSFMNLIYLLRELDDRFALGLGDEDRKELVTAITKELKTRY